MQNDNFRLYLSKCLFDVKRYLKFEQATETLSSVCSMSRFNFALNVFRTRPESYLFYEKQKIKI